MHFADWNQREDRPNFIRLVQAISTTAERLQAVERQLAPVEENGETGEAAKPTGKRIRLAVPGGRVHRDGVRRGILRRARAKSGWHLEPRCSIGDFDTTP